MDLTVETKQYIFSVSSGFDYIIHYLCKNLHQYPNINSYHFLTKSEVLNLIEYLKQNGKNDSRDFWIVDRLINMEMLMEGKERATFHFW